MLPLPPHNDISSNTSGFSVRSGRRGFSLIQALVVLVWVTVPFLVALAVPKDDMNAYFMAIVGFLALLSFGVYSIWFGLTESLLIGLIFITNSAFVDHAYLPRVPLLGGNFYLSDYYLLLATSIVVLLAERKKTRVLGTYHRYFVLFACAMTFSSVLGLIRGAEVHYVLRELHPLVYYPLALFIAIQAVQGRGALPRILVVSTGIVLVSCGATLWQLFLTPDFQFMTFAAPVYGLAEGEVLDARLIRPPSDWLFLTFFLLSVATYPRWKERRFLVSIIVLLDAICIMLGYSRTMFAAIIAALAFLALIRKRKIGPFLWSLTKTTVATAGILFLIYSAVNATAPAYTDAFKRRILGSFETSLLDSDEPFLLGSRVYETQMAIDHIIEHPILGLGTGAEYRDILPFELSQSEVSENPEDGRHFMHNAYIFAWMKYGLLGGLAMGMIAWHFLKETWFLARQPGAQSLLPQGILTVFAGFAIANVAAPSFFATPAGPTILSIMAAVIEVQSKQLARPPVSVAAQN